MVRIGLSALVGLAAWFSAVPIMALTVNETFSGAGPYSITDFTAVVEGDYTNNGTVNGSDFLLWQQSFGAEIQLPNDLTPGTVDGDDLAVWKQRFGNGRPMVAGFDEPGWNRVGTRQTGLGTFDTVNGTYDVASHDAIFILNIEPLDSDVWQAINGVNRGFQPGGKIELTAGFRNFVPGTAKEQRLMVQLDFGLALGLPNLLDFIDLQLVFYPNDDRYELVANPLLDGAPAAPIIVRNPRGEGLIGPDETIDSIDWRVEIDSDQVNGGSTINVEFDLNQSGTWTSFYGDTISGLDYTNDLTQAQNATLIMQAYGSPGLLPTGTPDPMVSGPAVSFDYLSLSTPDVVPPEVGAVPEPAAVTLFGLGALVFCRLRRFRG